jgi:hypothetical protein
MARKKKVLEVDIEQEEDDVEEKTPGQSEQVSIELDALAEHRKAA